MAFDSDVTRVSEYLMEWKEIVVITYGVLSWEKDWHPAAIIGSSVAFFLAIWYWDPTLLTMLAMSGLVFTLLDFVLPKILSKILNTDDWSVSKETKFKSACSELNTLKHNLEFYVDFWAELKRVKAVVHFLCSISFLLFVVFLGGIFNHFFVLFVLTTVILVLPGLNRIGALKTAAAFVATKMEAVRGKKAN